MENFQERGLETWNKPHSRGVRRLWCCRSEWQGQGTVDRSVPVPLGDNLRIFQPVVYFEGQDRWWTNRTAGEWDARQAASVSNSNGLTNIQWQTWHAYKIKVVALEKSVQKHAFNYCQAYVFDEQTWVKNIPHTGDTESLDRCGS